MIRISVVIPTLNAPTINQTLRALQRQTFDLTHVEVLVVGLDEPGLIQTNSLVHFIPTDGPKSPAINRNIGTKRARGDIICYLDADCVPFPDWLDVLAAKFDDPTNDVVGGGVVFDDANYWSFCDNLSWFYQFHVDAPAGERRHLPSLNLSVRRNVIETVGLFDDRYPHPAGEDTEWTQRIRSHGYRLYFEPQAIVRHCARRSTLRLLWKHGYNFGRYSPKIDRHVGRDIGEEWARFLPNTWWLMLLTSPFLASMATARVVAMHHRLSGIWSAIPGLWLSKMAWCCGASHALRQ